MKKISDENRQELRSLSKSDFINAMDKSEEQEILETENLIIKHPSERASRDFYKSVIKNKECTRYIQNSWIGEVKTFEDWNLRVTFNDNFWMVINKANKQVVCCIEVSNNYMLPEVASAQIIWFVEQDFSQTDFLVEAIKAIACEYFDNRDFFESEYDLMEIKINENQPGAAEICARAGFTKEGVLRNRCVDRLTGQKCNMEVWSFLREN